MAERRNQDSGDRPLGQHSNKIKTSGHRKRSFLPVKMPTTNKPWVMQPECVSTRSMLSDATFDGTFDATAELVGIDEMRVQAAEQVYKADIQNDISIVVQAVHEQGKQTRNLEKSTNEIAKLLLKASTEPPISYAAISKQIASQDQQISEFINKFKAYDKSALEGKFIWVIDNYWTRKQAELCGEVKRQVSPPFYSSKYGYKMCALAYLNGNKNGTDTSLGLYVQLLQGENDVVLEFPLTTNVHFTVHGLHEEMDLWRVVKSDITKKHSKRPPANMQRSFGKTLFADIDLIESEEYLINDKLYIEVEISNDTGGVEKVEVADNNICFGIVEE
ncbi:TNF receptor-associated factor 2-like [Watersipora subatra]|uniref:TNF receptor-associated factor 2-like n=1 Tax=Watersipora subatra TaxID=2589382 RepID=UPI00355B6078